MKKVIKLIISLFLIVIFINNVYAKTSIDANLSSEMEYVKAGEDAVITLNFDNYIDVTTGFNAYKATLEYDENVFEKVSENDFSSLNDWEELKYNPTTKEFVAIKKAGSKNAENVVHIFLKVKKDAKVGVTSVKVVNLVTSEGNEDIYTPKQEGETNLHEVKLNITKEVSTSSSNKKNNYSSNNINKDNINDNDNNIVDDNKVEMQDTLNNNDTIKDNFNKKSGFCTFGIIIGIILIPLFIGLLIIYLIIFKRRDKEDEKKLAELDKKDRMFIFIFTLIVISIQITGIVYASTLSKGDVNLDGNIDYTDIELIEYHLIHTPGKELTNDGYENADMNNDGQLTVTDLTLAVRKVEKTLDYEISVSDVKVENYYPKKNEEVTLKFTATAKYNARVTLVNIDGKEYEVKRNKNEYQVKVPVGDKSGLKTININSVTLYTGKVQKINEKITIDIQKDKPSIANYIINENADIKISTLSFDIVDNDSSFTSGIVQILNQNSKTEVISKNVIVGNNSLEFRAVDGIKYLVKITLNYDLATNQLEHQENYKGKQVFSYDYEFAFDYDFKILNIKTYKNQTETNSFSKNESIILSFNSSNNSKSIPSKITINDIEYNLHENGSRYEVELMGFGDSGEKELKITSVTLSDNKKFDIEENIKIEILKDDISLVDYSEKYDIESSNVTLKFNIEDDDNAFINGKAILINNDDNTLQEVNIVTGENLISFAIKEDVPYSLKVSVSYAKDSLKQNIINETIKTADIELVRDYKLNVSDLNTSNLDKQTKYFNKNEMIKIDFNATNSTPFDITKVFINGKEYSVSKNENQYQTNIDSYEECGVFDINLEKLILENGKEILTNLSTKIEVLKDEPRIEDFSYNEDKDSNQITVTFILHDDDSTIKRGTITVLDNKEKIIFTSALITGENTITFQKTDSQFYDVVVKADYDLDTNKLENDKNEYNNHILLYEEIESIHEYKIEIKDIQDITLYKLDGTDVIALSSINISDLNNLSDYLVKISMKDLPSLYTTIKSYSTDDGILKFKLDFERNIQYDKDGEIHHGLEVIYGSINNDIAESDTMEDLINKIKNNPNGTYKLTHDFDFSSITSGEAVIDVDFKGTLDGNGYTISNLSIPLFKSLNGATVENFVIQNASVNSYGLLASKAVASTIRNVHLKNVVVNAPGVNGTGSLVGTAEAKSLIENCSATNITVGNAKRTGGLIGKMNDSTVRNCYVQGKVSSTSDASGGLVGDASTGTIENCYVNVSTNFAGTSGSIGGLLGNPINTLLKNNISIANSISGDGHGFRIYGKYRYNVNANSINNYELATSNLISNKLNIGTGTVEIETLKSKDFYVKTLRFSENIWDFTNIENSYPTLKGADPNYVKNQENKPNSENIYIPDYQRISKLSAYDLEKEILYHNLYELMPFYDAKYIVLEGAKIPQTDILNKKIIKSILPYDGNGRMMVTLTKNNVSNLKKIKVIFEDNTVKEYTVSYEITENFIATYKIKELDIYYNYNKYLIKDDASVLNDLVSYIGDIDYTADLDPLTNEADSRLYKDYFNEQIKSHARDFILELLHNDNDISLTIENDVLNNKIKNEYIGSNSFKQTLYAYNYYKRWYSINIGGLDVADLMLIHGNIFSRGMTRDALTKEFLASGNRATNRTSEFYTTSLSKYTGYRNVTDFLDKLIVMIGGYSDVNDWFTENWQGAILEVPLKDYPEVNYRAWPHLKAWPAKLLPFLTVPKNSGFIVSGPTNFVIGGQRIYIANPDDPAQHKILIKKMEDFGKLMGDYYNTIAGSVDASILNKWHDIHYDTTKWKKSDGSITFIESSSAQSNEPYMKNFNEAVNEWPNVLKGVNAYGYSNRVYYRVAEALNAFGTWSHEGGHAQDTKIFLKGASRRRGGQGEDYADGNTSQYHGDGSINFNLAYHYTMKDAITTNLTPERINTSEKMHDYYRKMFETLYILDYAEAQAFLRLTPEEQAKVSVRVSYPDVEKYGETSAEAYYVTGYTPSTKEDLQKMNLKTMADLWDNQITIRPGVTGYSSVGRNKYGGASLYNRRWYQPHNDYGRPDSYSLKYLAWEMMGYGGYDNGYIAFYSNKADTDLAGLKSVTGDSNITWREYKLNRFQETANLINNSAYIDAETLINEYEKALKADAKNNDRNVTISTNVRRTYYHYLKRVTNDFRDEIFMSKDELEENKKITHISTAKQLQEKITKEPYGYYVLDNDIDVSNLTGTNAIIDKTFFGKLDGNGHTITGNKLPLFNQLNYSVVSNLKLNSFDVNYVGGQIGLANAIATTTHIYNVTSSERKIEIATLEDFLKIGVDSEYPLGKSYYITADIDFSQIKNTDIKTCSADGRNGNCIVSGIFTGKIYGNGHTLSNLTGATLFNDFRGTVSDLNITDFTNRLSNQSYVSAFARVSNNANFSNMKFKNITLSGDHGVAPVVGMDGRTGNSTFSRISVENANVTGSGFYISAFVGRKFGGSITDCFVQGTVSFSKNANAGVIGAIQGNEKISNVISDVTIKRTKNSVGYDNNGGMFGELNSTPYFVENSIALGNITYVDGSQADIGKFISKTTIMHKMWNCFEYEDALGLSLVTEDTNGKLNLATNDDIHSIEFYRDTLKFNSDFWDFSSVETNGYPTLK